MHTLSRKTFLRQITLAGLGTAAAGPSLIGRSVPASLANVLPNTKIGLQLYTIIPLLQKDFEGTLNTLAEIGYRELEFAGPYHFSAGDPGENNGFYGHSPGEMRSLLDRLEMTGPAAHVGLDTLRANLPQTLETAHTVGINYVVCPFLAADERQSLDDYRSVASELNEIGAECAKAGIRLGYHNHSFEFAEMEGEIPFNMLLELTDPELVSMELDLFWITVAGFDPVDYFESYPGRFHSVHVKDIKKKMVLDHPAEMESMKQAVANLADAGKGVIDFERILSHHRQAGIEHYFVERDFPANPMETVRNAYAFLSRLELK
ncbi:MAG: sugar phosphate isomerase/epimerase [Balneolaceae bacterium]|nr:sugar phosphate isomerase/epimerase [Balneolaceae bacterium]